MLVHPVTYEDLDGNMVTEEFHFNLTKTELRELQFEGEETLGDVLKRIVETQDMGGVISQFKKIVLAAYGRKSEDGRRFVKSPELAHEFSQHVAFDGIFSDLLEDSKFAADFIIGMMPKDFAKYIEEATREATQTLPPPTEAPVEA